MTMAITFIPGDISSGCGAILILLFFTLIPVSFAGMMTDVPAVPCLHHITPMIARARGIIIMAQPIINMIPSLMPDIVKFMGDHNEALRDYRIPKIILVDKMSELLEESAKCILRNVIPAPVIDEMDSALVSSQMRGKIGVSLQAYTWVERHLDTQGPLLVYHYYWSIPKDVRIGGLAHKILGVFWYSNYVTRRRKRVVSRPDMWEFNPTRSGMRYFPVALTSLPYHNKGWSSYHIDVDMQWVNQKIGNATQREAARRILEMMPKREWEKEEKKEPKKREKDAK